MTLDLYKNKLSRNYKDKFLIINYYTENILKINVDYNIIELILTYDNIYNNTFRETVENLFNTEYIFDRQITKILYTESSLFNEWNRDYFRLNHTEFINDNNKYLSSINKIFFDSDNNNNLENGTAEIIEELGVIYDDIYILYLEELEGINSFDGVAEKKCIFNNKDNQNKFIDKVIHPNFNNDFLIKIKTNFNKDESHLYKYMFKHIRRRYLDNDTI